MTEPVDSCPCRTHPCTCAVDTAGCVCESDYTACPHHPVQPWIPRESRTPDDWERMHLTAEARRRGAERQRDALVAERDRAQNLTMRRLEANIDLRGRAEDAEAQRDEALARLAQIRALCDKFDRLTTLPGSAPRRFARDVRAVLDAPVAPPATPRPRRYDQCDHTCTVDCGHCKGQGPPAADPAEMPHEFQSTPRVWPIGKPWELRCGMDDCRKVAEHPIHQVDPSPAEETR